MSRALIAATAAVAAVTTAGLGACRGDPVQLEAGVVGLDVRSNITRADYVGPATCAPCHPDKLVSWEGHLHRTMNAAPGPDSVIGEFSGSGLSYGGGSARFFIEQGRYWMETISAAGVARTYEIVLAIGSAFIQEYVGVQRRGPEPEGHPIYRTRIRLPFGYWRRPGRWFHQQYYDSWFGPEYRSQGPTPALSIDPYAPELESWRSRCPWCHNTYPFEQRLLRSQGPRALGKGIERHVRYRRSSTNMATGGRLDLDQLVTVGISCESCHLGAREHVLDSLYMRFGPEHPALEPSAGAAPWIDGGKDEPRVIAGLCAQCHSAPSPLYADGGARRNSSESLDLLASDCGATSCVDCHDPHRRHGDMKDVSITACTGCHRSLADASAARAHSRHDGADCLDCHMPKLVQGFSSVVRTHRIGRAFEPRRVAAGEPNACNLCHLDRSVGWAARMVELYWRRQVQVPAGPDGEAPAGRVWLDSSDPHVMVTAADAYARSPLDLGRAALPALARRLDQPIAYYRMRMLFAIEDILDRQIPPSVYDPSGSPEHRRRQLEALRLAP